MKQKYLNITHNGTGWTGLIHNQNEYESLRDGTMGFGRHNVQPAVVQLPYDVFEYLMNLDRTVNNIKPQTPEDIPDSDLSHAGSIFTTAAIALSVATQMHKK